MTSRKDIRTGVIGVGSMGQNHARVYNDISNLVAVSDYNEVQGEKVAKRFGVKYYKDYKEMLSEIDAVSVAVPTIYHNEVSLEVVKSGTHLLVEKPLSENFDSGLEIVKMATEKSVIMAVGHIERHNPVVKFAKQCIENNEWGQVITMSSQRVSKYPLRIKDVGVVLDLASHDIDVIRYLSGSDVNQVFALGGRLENSEKEDHASILLGFENGINGLCEVSWLTPMKVRKLSITCTEAYVTLDFANQEIFALKSDLINISESDLSNMNQDVEQLDYKIKKQEPLKLELEDFLISIIDNKEPLVTGMDGLINIKIAEEVINKIK